MSKRLLLIGLVLLFLQCVVVSALLWGRSHRPERPQNLVRSDRVALVARLLERMTLEQKVGQLLHIGMRGKGAERGVVSDINRYYPGGVIHFAHNYGSADTIRQMNRDLQYAAIKAGPIPLFISTDQEGGRVVRVGPQGTTQFPGAMATGQAADPGLSRQAAFVMGRQLLDLGINLPLAPVLDVNNNPANPVIQTRSFGMRLEQVETSGIAWMRGLQMAGSTPVIKHFPGHGDTSIDSHLDLPVIRKTAAELSALELKPFQQAIASGADVVMTAHILFPELDPDDPATLSPKILKGLLRRRLGFSGLIMSDAMEMKAVARRYGQGEAAVKAFAAGVDVILLTSDGPIIGRMHQALLRAFKNGSLSQADLNLAVARQLDLKLRKGILWRWNQDLIRRETSPVALARLEQDYKANGERRQSEWQRLQMLGSAAVHGPDYINQQLSRKSIRSLGQSCNVARLRQDPSDQHRTSHSRQRRFYYQSGIMYDEARLRGWQVPTELVRLTGSRQLRGIAAMTAGTVVVELHEHNIPEWNRMVASLDHRPDSQLHLVGLYTGNPFLTLRYPAQGCLLASFSPTVFSRRALVYQLETADQIPAADLQLTALQSEP
ncbi:MAG: hypothetical protein KDK39_11735 [Leptospiraceae bacterium]|nr:hypothetical protein [Leptospiraceae bacterium]